jgi:hypothetical protein
MNSNLDIPVSIQDKVASNTVDEVVDWHTEYWNNIGALLNIGAYMFVWGLVFAIVIAGGFLIVGAILMWLAAFLMAVTYPIWVFFGWVRSLFRR